MSNEELIAQARERIEGRIKSKKLDLKELDEMQSALRLTNRSFETSRITYTADLNILLTHLAEMDEHKNYIGLCDSCDNGVGGVLYPCDFLLTKVKRLLGATNDN